MQAHLNLAIPCAIHHTYTYTAQAKQVASETRHVTSCFRQQIYISVSFCYLFHPKRSLADRVLSSHQRLVTSCLLPLCDAKAGRLRPRPPSETPLTYVFTVYKYLVIYLYVVVSVPVWCCKRCAANHLLFGPSSKTRGMTRARVSSPVSR